MIPPPHRPQPPTLARILPYRPRRLAGTAWRAQCGPRASRFANLARRRRRCAAACPSPSRPPLTTRASAPPTPNPHPHQDTLHQLAFRRLELKRCDLPNMAMIVAEPFRLAAASAAAERDSWRYATERRVLQGFQLKRLCIVDSASLCLFANKLTSGVVLNIGFGK